MKLRSVLLLCLVSFGSVAMAETYTCTAKSNSLTFETKPMKSHKTAHNDAIARCNSSTKTSNEQCSANVTCTKEGLDNKLAGIQHICKTMSRGARYEIADSDYDKAVLVLEQCLQQKDSSDEDCNRNFQCKEIKRDIPFICFIEKNEAAGEPGATLDEAVTATIRASRLDEEAAFGKLFCSEKGGAPKKFKAPVNCWSFAAGASTPMIGSTNEDRASEKALAACYSKAGNGNIECRKNLTCESPGNPRRLMIKTKTCSTKSAGIPLSVSDTDKVDAQVLNLCRKDSSMDLGECKANLTCDGERVSRTVHRCTTNNDTVQISAIDVDKDAAERSSRDLCEAHAGSADPECRKNLRCDSTTNNVRMDFKNTIVTKSGGSNTAAAQQSTAAVIRPPAVPAPPRSSGVVGQGTAADANTKAGSGTIAPAKAFSADDDGALTDLPNPNK